MASASFRRWKLRYKGRSVGDTGTGIGYSIKQRLRRAPDEERNRRGSRGPVLCSTGSSLAPPLVPLQLQTPEGLRWLSTVDKALVQWLTLERDAGKASRRPLAPL